MEAPTPVDVPAVILIAASAGGIRALSRVFQDLPAGFAAPIVVVQHRSPQVASMLAAVLRRTTPLKVRDAEPGEALEAGTIYLARADLHLTLTDAGRFEYSNGHRIRHVLSSANPLFESASTVLGNRAIAVVLTGSGGDGTDGVQSIKARGGTVIAQDKDSSEHFGMPGSAIDTGAVDHVLPLEEIAPALVRLVREKEHVSSMHE